MKSIKTRIMAIFICFSIILSAVIGLTIYFGARSELLHVANAQLEQMVSANVKLVVSRNEMLMGNLETIAQQRILTDDTSKAERVAFLDREAIRLGFQTLGIAQLSGQALLNDGTTADLSDRAYIAEAITGKRSISDILISKATNTAIMVYAVPVYDSEKKVVAVMLGTLDALVLSEITSEMAFGDNGYVFIVDKQGTNLAHPETNLVIDQVNVIEQAKTNKDYQQLADIFTNQLIQGKSGIESYFYEGTERIMSFAPVPDTTWSLACTTLHSDFLAGVDQLRNITLMICLALILLGALIAFFFSNSMAKPIKNALAMMQEMSHGQLDRRLNLKAKDEIGRMARAMDRFADDLQGKIIRNMQRIAAGDVSMDLSDLGDRDEITPALRTMIEAIRKMIVDAEMLVQAAVGGKLDVRADADLHQGDFRKIVVGVNATLDAVVGPINLASDYISRMARGESLAEITVRYQGDYAVLIDNLNQVRSSLDTLLNESGTLVGKALGGDLSYRADVSRLQGSYATIVQGINQTLDAIVKPFQESAAVLDEMAKGNLKQRMQGDYKGDHALIKQAMNRTLDDVSSYIEEISLVLTEMAHANLVVEIKRDYHGDFSRIKDALNLIIETFNTVLYDFNSAADQVSAGARQVSEGSMALSQGTSEQASSIEELTASLTQVASQTRQNADYASKANGLALEAKNNAVAGNNRMQDMLKAMNEINTSSNNIARIIKVIDDIAFQTKILALNAAVEAARAGQHGKGFAVVAEEVRNLSARSAEAAKETTSLIESSIKSVADGSQIADTTAQALDQIMTNISKAAELVGTIADSSNEQATSIAEINQGIGQVSAVVQANSATSEESAAASEELSGQAQMLKDQIAQFKLKSDNCR